MKNVLLSKKEALIILHQLQGTIFHEKSLQELNDKVQLKLRSSFRIGSVPWEEQLEVALKM